MMEWMKRLLEIRGMDPARRNDPFADPAVAGMSLQELADLPLVPPPAPAQVIRLAERRERAQQSCRA
ncbi:hypothetical protein GR170_01720 [Pseudooceanicola sp. GBMRC 2024]|uniref:Uncharacterized protein n=1 Tax=Pseudooceanicola albus TaxID=2692189 RepID=A0A6L7FZ51_9RHOB|nr:MULTISPECIES: hypothetical protein [Pseudooceanicola]MXN16538.1 hypothetical protein [Pseudooceanicola albus]